MANLLTITPSLPSDFPTELAGPIIFFEYRMAHPERQQDIVLRTNNWSVLGETPFGDRLLGSVALQNNPSLSSDPAILISHSAGDPNSAEGVRSLGVLVDNVDHALEHAWSLEAADVFEDGPVGLLRLNLPALRWTDQRFYFLIDKKLGLNAVSLAMVTGR